MPVFSVPTSPLFLVRLISVAFIPLLFFSFCHFLAGTAARVFGHSHERFALAWKMYGVPRFVPVFVASLIII